MVLSVRDSGNFLFVQMFRNNYYFVYCWECEVAGKRCLLACALLVQIHYESNLFYIECSRSNNDSYEYRAPCSARNLCN